MSKESSTFESLAHQYMDALYTRALEVQSDMALVEDLVQRTFQKSFGSFSTFHRGNDFKQWLFSLLDDIVQDQQRQAA